MFDVIIIGGSHAGLSAAMSLGRSLRQTLVIDGGDPCNKRAPVSHNFITQDGKAPGAIAALAAAQVLAYDTVRLLPDRVTELAGQDGSFAVTTASGDTFESRKVLFATGLHDELPEVPGLGECWAITAVHCPYCHGYEFRGQPTGILMNTEHLPFMSRLIANLTDELTVFTNGPAHFDVAEVADGVRVSQQPLDHLRHTDGQLEAAVLSDGTSVPLTALYVHPKLSQKCPLPEAAGCALNENGFLVVDDHGLTTVPGIYAAGDCTTMMRSVAYATGSGNVAGAMINHGLLL